MADEPVNDPPKETDPPSNDPPKDTDPPKEPDTKPRAGESVEDTVRRVVKEMMGNRPPGNFTRGADIEKMAEDMVKEASAKLERERQAETRLTTVEQTLEDVKKRTEETPRKLRRSTRAMWGSDK